MTDAVVALCVYAYFLWSAVSAVIGVVLGLSEGISILDICIILLSIAGAAFSVEESLVINGNLLNFLSQHDKEAGWNLLTEALEAGVMVLIFEVALPKLIKGVNARFKFNETKFYEFITRKWGGKK